MLYKKWVIAPADKEKASLLSEKLNIDPFTAYLLVSRGIEDELAASEFLSDSSRLSSPFSLKDMDKAVNRIKKALENGEKICIYGDYDCDGVTSTAVLYIFLRAFGADVSYFIPNRITDGYGMNIAAIDKIKDRGTDLIITVDNGISAIDEAEYIYSLGMELVITDHHQIGASLPKAEAVINPHREDNDIEFRDFAGVGVALKLVCALYSGDADDILNNFADLAAIGTIGDMVSLLGENRTIVKRGLELIANDSRPGVAAIKKIAGKQGELSSSEIAYLICPRINAAGRMSSADIALELLLLEDYEEAVFKARMLDDENTRRHLAEEKINSDINEQINKNPALAEDSIIVIAGKNYHKGVIGICASHICERFGKPAIIISTDDEGNAVGSARSVDGFNIYEAISACADLLSHFGGHPLAAGIGLSAESIDEFRKKINFFCDDNFPAIPAGVIRLDCKLSPFYIDVKLLDSLSVLEPYGTDNKEPVFGLYNMTILSISAIGNGKHMKIEAQKNSKKVRMVKFGMAPDEFPRKAGDKCDFAVKISKNIYNGRKYVSVRMLDCRKSSADMDRYFEEKNDFTLFKRGRKNKTEMYPNRDICAVLYKFLRKSGGYSFSLDDLYFEFNGEMSYGQLIYAIDAFEETGLISRNNGAISLNKVEKKADLDACETLKALKGRM